MDIAYSKNGVPIRLNYERWYHITENHDELASYYHDILEIIENPDFIIRGSKGTLKATRVLGKRRWLTVIYREVSRKDGFIITECFGVKVFWGQKCFGVKSVLGSKVFWGQVFNLDNKK